MQQQLLEFFDHLPSSWPGLLGDALAEKIVEMHESCTEGSGLGVDGPGGVKDGAGKGSSATPKEYVSFLRSWFGMHESKKVSILAFSLGGEGVPQEKCFSRNRRRIGFALADAQECVCNVALPKSRGK